VNSTLQEEKIKKTSSGIAGRPQYQQKIVDAQALTGQGVEQEVKVLLDT
jgi:hypothetical protein